MSNQKKLKSSKANKNPVKLSEIQELNAMFGAVFPEKAILKSYEDCSCNFQECLEYLLNLQEGKGQISLPTQTSQTKESPNGFEKLVLDFQDLLTITELEDIWEATKKQNWRNNFSPTELMTIASSAAEERVVAKYCQEEFTSSTPIISSANDFGTLVDLFSGVIPQETLDTIWNNVHSSSKDEDKFELATLYTLEYLEWKNAAPVVSTTTKVSSSSNSSKNNKNDLRSYLVQQEMNRVKHSSSFPSKRRTDSPTSSESLITEHLFDVFKDSVVTEKQIIDTLLICNYDLSLTMENLCETALKNNSFTRGISYSEAVYSHIPAERKKLPTALSSVVDTVKTFNSTSSTDVETLSSPLALPPVHKKFSSLPSYSNYPTENKIKLSNYFFQTFQKKNEHLVVEMNRSYEFLYHGLREEGKFLRKHWTNKNSNPDGQIMNIRIDFHGLPVNHSTEIVDSCLTYYYNNFVQTTSHHSSWRKIVITFIVGKGIHSPGGIPRLGPGIEKFLTEYYSEFDYFLYDGELIVTLNRR
jgi:hypothetical protein